MGLQFTVEDLKTPEGTERVLRQFQDSILRMPTGFPAQQKVPSVGELVGELAPLIRSQLQAPGGTPLNLQSLLPALSTSACLEDTHANRLALYPPGNFPVGTLFYETDRTVLYGIVNNSGTFVWQYITGLFIAVFGNRPTDLGTSDRGFQLFVTVQAHTMWWSGTQWFFLDEGGGKIVDFVTAPPSPLGWQLCDGTATDYLVISGADLALTAFTTPDENSGAAGVYHKSIAAYTGTINAATAGAMSGITAANSTGITVNAHGVTQITDVAGANNYAFTAAGDAGHTVVDPQHQHLFGTIAVDATGQPRNMGVLRYFRR